MANPKIRMETTLGNIDIELFMDKMPLTASNFLDIVKNGWYDGVHFHRVIKNFMCQFGDCAHAKDPKDPRAGTGGCPGKTTFQTPSGPVTRSAQGNIPDELTCKLGNEPFTISMANTGAPNSGGSQIFINTVDNAYLNWFDDRTPSKHPVFGKIADAASIDVVKKIEASKTVQDRPNPPVCCIKAVVL